MVSELVLAMATVADLQAVMEARRGAEAEKEDYEERTALQEHLAAARDTHERAQAEAAREEGVRGEAESEARLQPAVTGSGVEETLVAVLERSGGLLLFLQAAIDVAHRRSSLFRDPSMLSTVMAAAVRAQMEAEERAAREVKKELDDLRDKLQPQTMKYRKEKQRIDEIRKLKQRREELQFTLQEKASKARLVEVKKKVEEKPESSVEKDCMVVDKKQATAAKQVAGLEAAKQAAALEASIVQSQKRILEPSYRKNKKENEVYKQEMEVKLHEHLQELEVAQFSEVDQKHIALVTEVATLQSEIDQEMDKVKKLAEHFTAKELVELAQIFLAKSSELMSVSQGPNDRKNLSSTDDTSGNLVSLARPGTG